MSREERMSKRVSAEALQQEERGVYSPTFNAMREQQHFISRAMNILELKHISSGASIAQYQTHNGLYGEGGVHGYDFSNVDPLKYIRLHAGNWSDILDMQTDWEESTREIAYYERLQRAYANIHREAARQRALFSRFGVRASRREYIHKSFLQFLCKETIYETTTFAKSFVMFAARTYPDIYREYEAKVRTVLDVRDVSVADMAQRAHPTDVSREDVVHAMDFLTYARPVRGKDISSVIRAFSLHAVHDVQKQYQVVCLFNGSSIAHRRLPGPSFAMFNSDWRLFGSNEVLKDHLGAVIVSVPDPKLEQRVCELVGPTVNVFSSKGVKIN